MVGQRSLVVDDDNRSSPRVVAIRPSLRDRSDTAADKSARKPGQLAGASQNSVSSWHWLFKRTSGASSSRPDDDIDKTMTIGPYVRFMWVVSLGVIDTFLVLVLLCWPESDYMCHRDTASSLGVIGKGDVVPLIGAVLLLHLCDLVC